MKSMFGVETHDNLGSLLVDALYTHKNKLALIEKDRSRTVRELSYADVISEVKAVVAWMRAHRLNPSDGLPARVGVLMTNQSKWLIAATAVFHEGLVLVPIDYKLGSEDQQALISHAGVSVLVSEPHLLKKLSTAGLHVLSTESWPTPNETLQLQPKKTLKADIATLVYSSGTSGRAKGCMLSHGAYLDQLQMLLSLYPMHEGDRYFSILPTNHAIDFMVGFVGPFVCGATVVHQHALRPEFILSTMRETGITHMAVVPAILEAFERGVKERIAALPPWKRAALNAAKSLHDKLQEGKVVPDVRLSRTLLGGIHEGFGGKLEYLFCGGAFLKPECALFFKGYGFKVAIGYGMTECCTVATLNRPDELKVDSVGKPLPGVELDLKEADLQTGVGEVWIRSPGIMSGYFKDPELTKETIKGAWLRSGDLGIMDEGGSLKLVGRKKNMVVTPGGKNIYPEDVEKDLGDLDVEEYVVFGTGYVLGSSMADEGLLLAIRPKTSTADWKTKLKSQNLKLPEHKRIDSILLFNEAFPRTASMKVKREELAIQIKRKVTEEQVSLEKI